MQRYIDADKTIGSLKIRADYSSKQVSGENAVGGRKTMKVKVSPKKVREITGIRKIYPIFVKTTIVPIWNGLAYDVTVSLNLFGKIVQTFFFPVGIFLNGILEAWDDLTRVWRSGSPYGYFFENGEREFEAIKKLYEENN